MSEDFFALIANLRFCHQLMTRSSCVRIKFVEKIKSSNLLIGLGEKWSGTWGLYSIIFRISAEKYIFYPGLNSTYFGATQFLKLNCVFSLGFLGSLGGIGIISSQGCDFYCFLISLISRGTAAKNVATESAPIQAQ